jgi:GT2 family glycosyltransferase
VSSHLTKIPPHVYIVLLNWNGWRDTIECLESVFRLDYPRFTVIVCDNASTDGSLETIDGWARGTVLAAVHEPGLSRLVQPPVPKPVQFLKLDSGRIADSAATGLAPLVLIQTGSNLGFAGGNNAGIRYALKRDDCDYVWLLNNDTVIEPDALSRIVEAAEQDPQLGICGSRLRTYASPHETLTAGGRKYNRWTGRTRRIKDVGIPSNSKPPEPDYVEGASMLVSQKFLQEIGLLKESYFLYFEELDWAARARPRFRLGYCPTSIVYHKEGSSIGSALDRESRSTLSEFYLTRNRLVFTRRYHPWCLPSVLAAIAASALQRLLIGMPKNAAAILTGAVASFSRAKSRGQVIS